MAAQQAQGQRPVLGSNQGVIPNMPNAPQTGGGPRNQLRPMPNMAGMGMNRMGGMTLGQPNVNMGPNMGPPTMGAPNLGPNMAPAMGPNLGGPGAGALGMPPMAQMMGIPPNMMAQSMMFAGKKRKGPQPIDKWKNIPPNNTVYINNLNEKVSRDDLYSGLREVFGQYGKILDIVCYTKIKKCKGQAWVVFDKIESAIKAVSELQNFSFYNKPMHVHFSKNISDATLKRDGKACPRRERVPKSQRKRKSQDAKSNSNSNSKTDIKMGSVSSLHSIHGNNEVTVTTNTEQNSSNGNGNDNKDSIDIKETNGDTTMKERVFNDGNNEKSNESGSNGMDVKQVKQQESQQQSQQQQPQTQGQSQQQQQQQAQQPPMPIVPEAAPNKKLFLQNLPPDTNNEEMTRFLSQIQGFVRIMLVPNKPGIAFVDFKDIMTAQFALPQIRIANIRGYVIQAQFAQ